MRPIICTLWMRFFIKLSATVEEQGSGRIKLVARATGSQQLKSTAILTQARHTTGPVQGCWGCI
jgi:hypothetical protein